MTDAAQNLLALNIVIAIGTGIGLFLMIMWFRFTMRRWPNRKELLVRVGVNLFFWLGGNILYFYFRSH
jgi:hypothetical protein